MGYDEICAHILMKYDDMRFRSFLGNIEICTESTQKL